VIHACTRAQDQSPPRLPHELTLFSDARSRPYNTPGDLHRLPSIIRLSRHVGFTDKPLLQRALQKLLAQDKDRPFWVILDLEDATSVDTSVAKFLQSEARRLSLLDPAVRLVFAGARPASDMEARLSRWAEVGPGNINNFATTEQALHAWMFRYHSTPTENLLDSHAVLCINSILGRQDLSSSFEKSILNENFLLQCGRSVRRVSNGEAIACQRYPLLQSFLVLDGDVIVRSGHDTLAPRLQQPIRHAVIQVFQNLINRLRHRPNCSPHSDPSSNGTRCQYLVRGQLFDAGKQRSVCAYAASASCLVLTFDPDTRGGKIIIDRIANSDPALKY
jgi:anti-anti-sigma regulatory factor